MKINYSFLPNGEMNFSEHVDQDEAYLSSLKEAYGKRLVICDYGKENTMHCGKCTACIKGDTITAFHNHE